MKKEFECPELIIIFFEGDLATDDPIVSSSSDIDPDNDIGDVNIGGGGH